MIILKILNEKEAQNRRIKNMDVGYDRLKPIKELNKDMKLYNIAITHNNKIVEIGQIFKKKGVDNKYCQLLYSMINYYLSDKLEKGIKKLYDYGNFLDEHYYSNMKKSKFDSLLHEASYYLEQYKDIERELNDFSIDKDIKKVFEFYKEKSFEEEKKTGINSYVTAIIPNLVTYNKVIKNLGYDVSIEDSGYNYEEDTIAKEIKERVAGMTDDETKKFLEEKEHKRKFFINETQNMKKYFREKSDKFEEEYKDTPLIYNSYINQMSDYLEKAINSLSNSNNEEYEFYKNKFYDFNTGEEIVESIGKYVVLKKDLYDFYNDDILIKIKEELEKINRNDVYVQVIKNLDEHKYDDYVNERNKKYEDFIGNMRNVK